MTRIGLIGGLSWESSQNYYRLLNESYGDRAGPWQQPEVIIDSLNFAPIVELQHHDDWDGTGEILIDSARRLVAAGANVLAITANTMHINYDAVNAAVSVPVLDIRDAMATEVLNRGAHSLALLGTTYLAKREVYRDVLRARGVEIVRPTDDEQDELQSMIFDELTQGIFSEKSRTRFLEIAAHCRDRGAEIVGLCCTEFGLLAPAQTAPWPTIDSTRAHVDALLDFVAAATP